MYCYFKKNTGVSDPLINVYVPETKEWRTESLFMLVSVCLLARFTLAMQTYIKEKT